MKFSKTSFFFKIICILHNVHILNLARIFSSKITLYTVVYKAFIGFMNTNLGGFIFS